MALVDRRGGGTSLRLFFQWPRDGLRCVSRARRERRVSRPSAALLARADRSASARGGPAYFDEGSRIRWVWGYSLSERRPRLVPASFVYLNHRPGADEAAIGLHASTGLASGGDARRSDLECPPRDRGTGCLHPSPGCTARPGRRIEIDDDDAQEGCVRVRLWADRPGVDVSFFDLTTDVPIPVVFLVMRRQSERGPVVCLGAASRLSPGRAVHASAYRKAARISSHPESAWRTRSEWRGDF